MKLIRYFVAAFGLLVSSVAWAAAPLDINTASPEELATVIAGVGPQKARAIVRYRSEVGPFASVDELVNVKGIGLGIVEHNRELLSAGSAVN